MAKMILTLGLPASGKSTWAWDYVSKNKNTVIVCRDDIRADLFSPKRVSHNDPRDHMISYSFTQDHIKTLESQGKVTVNGTTVKRLSLIHI